MNVALANNGNYSVPPLATITGLSGGDGHAELSGRALISGVMTVTGSEYMDPMGKVHFSTGAIPSNANIGVGDFASLDSSGDLTVTGTVTASALIPTGLTAGTSPVCAHGTAGALTNVGCAGGGGGTPGGSTTQVQYNNAGAFAANANLTTNGTGNLTAAGTVTAGTAVSTPALSLSGANCGSKTLANADGTGCDNPFSFGSSVAPQTPEFFFLALVRPLGAVQLASSQQES